MKFNREELELLEAYESEAFQRVRHSTLKPKSIAFGKVPVTAHLSM